MSSTRSSVKAAFGELGAADGAAVCADAGAARRTPVRYEAVKSGGRPGWGPGPGGGRRTGSRRTNASSHCTTFGRYSLTTRRSTDALSQIPSSSLCKYMHITVDNRRYVVYESYMEMRQFRTKHYNRNLINMRTGSRAQTSIWEENANPKSETWNLEQCHFATLVQEPKIHYMHTSSRYNMYSINLIELCHLINNWEIQIPFEKEDEQESLSKAQMVSEIIRLWVDLQNRHETKCRGKRWK